MHSRDWSPRSTAHRFRHSLCERPHSDRHPPPPRSAPVEPVPHARDRCPRDHVDSGWSGGHTGRLGRQRAAGEPRAHSDLAPQVGASASAYLDRQHCPRCALFRVANRSMGPQALVHHHAGPLPLGQPLRRRCPGALRAMPHSGCLTGAGIGGEATAINSAIQELMPARYRGQHRSCHHPEASGSARRSARSSRSFCSRLVVCHPMSGWRAPGGPARGPSSG